MKGAAATVERVVEACHRDRGMLIQILLDLQESLGWLPRDVLAEVGRQLRLPASRVYQVATYYRAFRFEPGGRHSVKVCLGTACHVRGAGRIVERIEADLGIKPAGTTPDLKFTMDTVNCVGCCALGPMVMVDGEYHGQMTADRIRPLLAGYE